MKSNQNAIKIDSNARIDISMQTRHVSNLNRHITNTFVSTIFERRKRSASIPREKVENFEHYGPCILTRRRPSTTSTYLDIKLHILSVQPATSKFIRCKWNEKGTKCRFPFIMQQPEQKLKYSLCSIQTLSAKYWIIFSSWCKAWMSNLLDLLRLIG